MSKYGTWVSKLSLPQLTGMLLLVGAGIFGYTILWWLIANNLPWWAYGIVSTFYILGEQFAKATWKAYRAEKTRIREPRTGN